MSTLRALLEDYLATRRALGFKLVGDGTGLTAFVSHLEEAQVEFITNEAALNWARLPSSVQPVQWDRRLGFVRSFARYCSAFDSRTQVPPTDLIQATRLRRTPHFFDDDSIERLLSAALELPPQDGLRRWTFHCLFGLLSVSGLRIGEAIRLTLEDVDLQEAILTIRSTKFGKSRLVPMHPSTAEVVANYIQRRRSARAARATDPVFINARYEPLSHDQSIDTFQRLLIKIGVTSQREGRRPHLHDLRHRFAMRTLAQWYKEGRDVERQLPVLSAYLGHTETRDTYWYLSAIPELMGLARERLERHWEGRS